MSNIKHRMTDTKIYRKWSRILDRCRNINSPLYHRYGGRGITICNRWLQFENFYKDMAQGYIDGLTIERVNNDKGYCKENCRWATWAEQARNKSNTKLITINGITKCLHDWSKVSGIDKATISYRLKKGVSPCDAVFKKKKDIVFTKTKRVKNMKSGVIYNSLKDAVNREGKNKTYISQRLFKSGWAYYKNEYRFLDEL